LNGPAAIIKRVAQISSPSPAGIKADRNEAEVCPALPWFGGYVAIALDSGFTGYTYSLHQEPLSLWNPEAGNGRSPPFHVRSFQL
jgi:hypothetical protein